MDSHINIYLKKSRIASIVLILSLIICFISLELGKIQPISDFNYTLHEMIYIPISIGIFLIPLEVIFTIYYSIKWIIKVRRDTSGKSKTNLLLNVIAVLCLSLFVYYFFYMSYGVSISGVYENVGKEKQENKYYIVVQNIRVSCTRNEYNLINFDGKYLMSYKQYKLSPGVGELEYIEEVK